MLPPLHPQQNPVVAGIDKLHLTIPICHDLDKVVISLFGIPISNFSKRTNTRKLKWYATTYTLQTTAGHTLAAIHTDPRGQYNNRHLVQIHGLTLSDSSYNALRPLSIDHILTTAASLNANITAIDYYIDVFADLVPLDDLFVQSLPRVYKQFIRSPFLRDHKGVKTTPRILENGIYYGLQQRNSCQIIAYDKARNPRQDIYSTENPLKHPWFRFEVRLKGQTAKQQAKILLDFASYQTACSFDNPDRPAPTLYQYIAGQVSRYLQFVQPTSKRARRCPLQPWWSLVLQLAGVGHQGPSRDHSLY
jgi:DNA relaxase NicK